MQSKYDFRKLGKIFHKTVFFSENPEILPQNSERKSSKIRFPKAKSLFPTMLVCLYSCRGEKAKTKKTENRQFRKEEKNRRNVSRKLRKIQEIPDEDKPAKKREMKLITEKMPKKTQLQLIVAADNVPTTGGKSTLLT